MGEQATDKSYIDQLGEYFQQNPTIFGWLMVALGAVFLYGSVRRWGWLFEGGDGMFNIAWVAETFGFRTAQILYVLLSFLFVGAGESHGYIFLSQKQVERLRLGICTRLNIQSSIEILC